jgi:penicillin-binding protein 1A
MRARHRRRRRLARALVVVLGLVVGLCLSGTGYELSLPGVGDAQQRVAAILHAHHGALDPLPVPTRLGEAVVAVEDEHFYSNVFLNVFDGAARAALASLRTSGDPGGSTIAQQLAKQLYVGSSGLGATLEQIGLGVKLALGYSKAEILSLYLNCIYYGNGYWGDIAAARGYFGVRSGQLSWAEASMIAGLPQAPSSYDPLLHFALAKQRQRHVLDQLVVNHYVTQAQADEAYQAGLPFRRM